MANVAGGEEALRGGAVDIPLPRRQQEEGPQLSGEV